jgi:hypothetical protein
MRAGVVPLHLGWGGAADRRSAGWGIWPTGKVSLKIRDDSWAGGEANRSYGSIHKRRASLPLRQRVVKIPESDNNRLIIIRRVCIMPLRTRVPENILHGIQQYSPRQRHLF